MSTTAIIFIVLMAVMTCFTAGVLISELVCSRKEPASESETTEPTPAETEPASEAAATQEDAPVVEVPTHEQKYSALSDEARSLYDEIASYAAAVEGAQSKTGKSGEQYAIGSKRIVRLSIKNDVVVCSFTLRNSNFFAQEGENKIIITTASITTKITDSEHVSAAKNTIDMVVQSINEEKELKQKLARERRQKKKSLNDINNTEVDAE